MPEDAWTRSASQKLHQIITGKLRKPDNEKGPPVHWAPFGKRSLREGKSGRSRHWLRGALLLYILNLIHKIVGLLQEIGALIGAIHGVSLAAIEKIQICHGIVVVRAKLNGLLEILDAFVNHRTVFGDVFGTNGRRKRFCFL